jgi:hypothetical protein
MNKLNKVKLLFDSINENNSKMNKDYFDWEDVLYYIRIIISKDNFQNIQKIFELNFNNLLYFENIKREDGYSMKIRGKIINLYHSQILDDELTEFVNEIITYNDVILKMIGKNISCYSGNKKTNMHLFCPNKFISNKTITQIEIHLFKKILCNYLYRYIVIHTDNIDEKKLLFNKIRIEKEKLKIEEIIYRYTKIHNILKIIENLLMNDDEYKKSYFINHNSFVKKNDLLKLLKNVYINIEYKDDTLLSKLGCNEDEIIRLENIINSIIININNTIEKIRYLLYQEGDKSISIEKKWFCFSSFEIIHKHKIYSELLTYIK